MREPLRERLRKDRPRTTTSLRMREDVVDELKQIAPLLESLRRHGVAEEVINSAIAELRSA